MCVWWQCCRYLSGALDLVLYIGTKIRTIRRIDRKIFKEIQNLRAKKKSSPGTTVDFRGHVTHVCDSRRLSKIVWSFKEFRETRNGSKDIRKRFCDALNTYLSNARWIKSTEQIHPEIYKYTCLTGLSDELSNKSPFSF